MVITQHKGFTMIIRSNNLTPRWQDGSSNLLIFTVDYVPTNDYNPRYVEHDIRQKTKIVELKNKGYRYVARCLVSTVDPGMKYEYIEYHIIPLTIWNKRRDTIGLIKLKLRAFFQRASVGIR